MEISRARRGWTVAVSALLLSLGQAVHAAPASPAELAAAYRSRVARTLQLPQEETHHYGRLAELAFARAGIAPAQPQYLALVDRNPNVQALLLLWRSAAGEYELIGASPVSTGRPGSFDHFETPLGVFEHSPANPDFRAEGTFNANSIRGYGVKGMRVFDFGWQQVPKGWGDRKVIAMRLQMHATDPVLEQRLGTRQSKGCIRIPAGLNRLLDHHGVLDAEYERLAREGRRLWVLDEAREPVVDAGRYLVVVDSARTARPAWSPLPRPAQRYGTSTAAPSRAPERTAATAAPACASG